MPTVEERITALEALIQEQEVRLQRYESFFSSLMAFMGDAPIGGLRYATVVISNGAKKGDPAVVDAAGRVKVKVDWMPGGGELLARVAPSWLAPGGGVQFLPRQGMKVWLGFEDGQAEAPIIMGHLPDADDPFPYNPATTTEAGTLAATKDKNGDAYNPATPNKNKQVIAARSGGSSPKSSEIALVSESGKEALTLATGGEMRSYTAGDHYQTVGGALTTDVGGDENHHARGSVTRKVDGTLTDKVGSSKYSLTVDSEGNYTETIPGTFKQDVSNKYTVRSDGQKVWHLSQVNDTYQYWGDKSTIMLGNVNNVTVGEQNDVNASVLLRFYLLIEDIALFKYQQSIVNSLNTVVNSGNFVTRNKNAVAAINANLSRINSNTSLIKNVAVQVAQHGATLQQAATTLQAGLQVNM